jgi:putative heme-binding domain-containing protein
MRALLLLIAAATIAAQQRDEVRNLRTSPADVAAGAKTFRSHCSPCHGYDAEGGLGPRLAGGHFYHGSSDADLLNNISNGIPGTVMPGLFYSEDRIWQIVAYIRSLRASQLQPAGDPVSGRAVFLSKGCVQCHRVSGEGGRLGPDLTFIGESRAPGYLRQSIVDPSAEVQPQYWVIMCRYPSGETSAGFLMNEDTYTIQFIDMEGKLHSVAKTDLKEFHTEKTSKMPSYKDKLTPQQLDDLVAYLSSLRSKAGRE